MSTCWNCCEETSHYRCLKCSRAVCNRSKDCSVAASEEEFGWKAGHRVAFCTPCFQPCPAEAIYLEDVNEEDDDDPFEGKELADLQSLVNAMNPSCTAHGIVESENELHTCSGLLDESDPKKRDKARDKILEE